MNETDECREAFEKWVRSPDCLDHHSLSGYGIPSLRVIWQAAWTASRATVLEEAASLFHEEDGYLLTGAQIGRAIRALKGKS